MAAIPPGSDGFAGPSVVEAGGVEVQDGFGDFGSGGGGGQGAERGRGDGVPDGADLQGDQVVELVTAVRGGGQAEPATRRDLLHRLLERHGRDVVALVDDDQPVRRGQFGDVLAPGTESAAS